MSVFALRLTRKKASILCRTVVARLRLRHTRQFKQRIDRYAYRVRVSASRFFCFRAATLTTTGEQVPARERSEKEREKMIVPLHRGFFFSVVAAAAPLGKRL